MSRFVSLLIVTLVCTASLFASPNNRGYSGAPGSLGRCASSCHGLNNGTVQITGFPTEYVPDSTYLVTIAALTGSPIKNFNGSVRAGTGSTNAGLLAAGQSTVTYNVAQETNGIRLSAIDQTSATFNWRAPAAGTGTVRLYVAAHQGNRNQGPNTNLTIVANEIVALQPPGQPSNPIPANGATDVPTQMLLRWNAAAGATSYEVYLGNEESISSIGNSITLWLNSPDLIPGETYLWRVDAINGAGVTTGELWSFITEGGSDTRDLNLPLEFSVGQAYPNPFNKNVRISLGIPAETVISALVYDRTGRLVTTLVDHKSIVGNAQLEWNAAGQSAGVYFLRITGKGFSQTQKLVYLP